jgi:ankyrin repeat protein
MIARTLRTAASLALPAILLAGGIGIGAAEDADVNQRHADGSTPLQWAVYEGDVAEVRRLLDAGADVSLANNYGATPMGLAAEVANTEILKLLLEAGANADSPNPEGMTALMAVARTGNVEAAKALLERGATVDARENWGGQTALMWASARRHPQMMQLLISAGAAVDARSIHRDYQRHITAEGRPKSLDSGGFTPLLYAARENCIACVDVLIKNGADIDLPDPDGVSPLHLAVMNANWDLAKRLIEAGANVDQWDIFGAAPLFTAVGNRSRFDGGRASIDTPNETNGLDIIRLLLERGANPNMQLFFRPANVRGSTNTRGSTPLIRAANNADLELVQLLLEHGADATVYMADRQTPIHAVLAGRAPEKDALELIRILHEAGTDVNVVALVNHIEVRGGRRCTSRCANATRTSSKRSHPTAST